MNSLVNRHTVRVPYADTDKMGIVYNGNYLRYFEMGRNELMRANDLPYTKFEAAGYYLPLVSAHVDYKNTATYDDLLIIEASIPAEIRAIITFNYTIYRGETVICTGYTNHTFMSMQTMKPVKPPKFFLDDFRAFLEKMKK